jgi:hypothetical protein
MTAEDKDHFHFVYKPFTYIGEGFFISCTQAREHMIGMERRQT